ncbi:MAG: leucine-rich repeat protein, partial [Bacteroidaceae bacterium]|nr:leucine-rich repeat protein [Bacteroidaceae bacterium]
DEVLPWLDYYPLITNVVIEEGITYLGDYTFNGNLAPSLTSVTLPEGLEKIGYNVFRNCTSLTEITFLGGQPTLGGASFYLGKSSNPVTATIYSPGWASDDVFTAIVRGNYTTFIYETLTSEPLSGTCGNNANFTLDFSTGVLTINGTGAMTNYSTASPSPWYDYRNDITSVVIEDGITAIGNYAFYYHSAIPSITIPDSVTSIGKYAFASCSAATTVTIGACVTLISQKAFYACKLVTEVNFLGDQPTLEENSFQMGFSSTSKATATVYSSGWASDSVFTSTVKGNYTTLTYERKPGVYFLGVSLSSNPVNTGVTLIVSVELEVVTDSFTWDSLSTKTWNSVKTYTWNDLKGE